MLTLPAAAALAVAMAVVLAPPGLPTIAVVTVVFLVLTHFSHLPSVLW
jgi:hypothetical protein